MVPAHREGGPRLQAAPHRIHHCHHSRAGGRNKPARLTRVTVSLSETSRWNRALRTLGYGRGCFVLLKLLFIYGGNPMKIIYKDGHVAECPEEEELHVLRHSAAHIMAQAI